MALDKKIFKTTNPFSLFLDYLPFEEKMPFQLNKFKIFPPNDALCQLELRLAQWFWRRIFLRHSIPFSLFPKWYLLKVNWLILINLIVFPSRMFTAKFIGLMISEKINMWEVYADDNNNDNDDRQRTNYLIWAFGSGELINEILILNNILLCNISHKRMG